MLKISKALLELTDKINGGYMNRGEMKAKTGLLKHETELLVDLLLKERYRVAHKADADSDFVQVELIQIERTIEKLEASDEE